MYPLDKHPNRREALGLAAATLLPSAWAVAAPTRDEKLPTGVVVLDNCDPEYRGQEKYADNLFFFDPSGKLLKRITGLNVCEEIGSPHRIAVDALRKRVWVAETVGKRLLMYDLEGKELLAKPDVPARSLCVEAATGNVWVACSSGQLGIVAGSVEVFGPDGQSKAVHHFHGYDIVHDPTEPAFWLCDKDLLKVSSDGKVLMRKQVAEWCAVSVAINPKAKTVWVVCREHTKGKLGRSELIAFDRDGKTLRTIPLEDKHPYRVAADLRDGSVWVANVTRSLLHYSSDGKLLAEYDKIPAVTLDMDRQTEHVWVVTAEELLKLNLKGEVTERTKHKEKTSLAWIACY